MRNSTATRRNKSSVLSFVLTTGLSLVSVVVRGAPEQPVTGNAPTPQPAAAPVICNEPTEVETATELMEYYGPNDKWWRRTAVCDIHAPKTSR